MWQFNVGTLDEVFLLATEVLQAKTQEVLSVGAILLFGNMME